MKIICIGEHLEGVIKGVTFEAIGLAQRLKKLHGGKITLIMLGDKLDIYSEKLKNYEIDEIVYLENSNLALYNQTFYISALSQYLKNDNPDTIIMPHTSIGIDLAPGLAMNLDYPLITTIEFLKFENSRWTATRAIYERKVKEEVVSESTRILITIRPGDLYSAKEELGNPKITKIDPAVNWEKAEIKAIQLEKPEEADVDITKYDVIVSVGRGIGNKENIAMAEELAQELNGVVACSRVIADHGWLSKARQVGMSGKEVKPKLYLAIGISGATNHIMGMKNSGTIISINNDSFAPIFEISRYAIVGDLNKIIPYLIKDLKK